MPYINTLTPEQYSHWSAKIPEWMVDATLKMASKDGKKISEIARILNIPRNHIRKALGIAVYQARYMIWQSESY